jgi:hypothetical protein
VLARIQALEQAGLIVKPLFGRRFTVAYGELLAAERTRTGKRALLHTRVLDRPIRVIGKSRHLEERLRERGVRIVDPYGALITPTLADFERELRRRPG